LNKLDCKCGYRMYASTPCSVVSEKKRNVCGFSTAKESKISIQAMLKTAPLEECVETITATFANRHPAIQQALNNFRKTRSMILNVLSSPPPPLPSLFKPSLNPLIPFNTLTPSSVLETPSVPSLSIALDVTDPIDVFGVRGLCDRIAIEHQSDATKAASSLCELVLVFTLHRALQQASNRIVLSQPFVYLRLEDIVTLSHALSLACRLGREAFHSLKTQAALEAFSSSFSVLYSLLGSSVMVPFPVVNQVVGSAGFCANGFQKHQVNDEEGKKEFSNDQEMTFYSKQTPQMLALIYDFAETLFRNYSDQARFLHSFKMSIPIRADFRPHYTTLEQFISVFAYSSRPYYVYSWNLLRQAQLASIGICPSIDVGISVIEMYNAIGKLDHSFLVYKAILRAMKDAELKSNEKRGNSYDTSILPQKQRRFILGASMVDEKATVPPLTRSNSIVPILPPLSLRDTTATEVNDPLNPRTLFPLPFLVAASSLPLKSPRLFNVMLGGIASSPEASVLLRAPEIMRDMKEAGVRSSVQTYTYLIKISARQGNIDVALQALSTMRELSLEPSAQTYTSLLHSFASSPTASPATSKTLALFVLRAAGWDVKMHSQGMGKSEAVSISSDALTHFLPLGELASKSFAEGALELSKPLKGVGRSSSGTSPRLILDPPASVLEALLEDLQEKAVLLVESESRSLSSSSSSSSLSLLSAATLTTLLNSLREAGLASQGVSILAVMMMAAQDSPKPMSMLPQIDQALFRAIMGTCEDAVLITTKPEVALEAAKVARTTYLSCSVEDTPSHLTREHGLQSSSSTGRLSRGSVPPLRHSLDFLSFLRVVEALMISRHLDPALSLDIQDDVVSSLSTMFSRRLLMDERLLTTCFAVFLHFPTNAKSIDDCYTYLLAQTLKSQGFFPTNASSASRDAITSILKRALVRIQRASPSSLAAPDSSELTHKDTRDSLQSLSHERRTFIHKVITPLVREISSFQKHLEKKPSLFSLSATFSDFLETLPSSDSK
jgi:pentatricopeptide repeat protein